MWHASTSSVLPGYRSGMGVNRCLQCAMLLLDEKAVEEKTWRTVNPVRWIGGKR